MRTITLRPMSAVGEAPLLRRGREWAWRVARRAIRPEGVGSGAMSHSDAEANPHLEEALRLVRGYDGGKRREIARFLFDNLCYFDFWKARGSAELLQLAVLALDGRTVSRRNRAEPEALFIVRLWAADRVAAEHGRGPPGRNEANEALLRRFAYRYLPRAEIEEIRSHDWGS